MFLPFNKVLNHHEIRKRKKNTDIKQKEKRIKR